jgi:hypothetical protein
MLTKSSAIGPSSAIAAVCLVGLLATAPAAIAKPYAELTVKSLSAPPKQVKPGGSFKVRARTKNVGQIRAPQKSGTGFVLSQSKRKISNNAWDLRGTVPVGRLRPGQSSSGSTTVKVDRYTDRGTYWLVGCADMGSPSLPFPWVGSCRVYGKRPVKVIPASKVEGYLDWERHFVDTRSQWPSGRARIEGDEYGMMDVRGSFDGAWKDTGSSWGGILAGTAYGFDANGTCKWHYERGWDGGYKFDSLRLTIDRSSNSARIEATSSGTYDETAFPDDRSPASCGSERQVTRPYRWRGVCLGGKVSHDKAGRLIVKFPHTKRTTGSGGYTETTRCSGELREVDY